MPNPDYKRMFEDLNPYYPEPNDLNDLATVMSGRTKFLDAAPTNNFLILEPPLQAIRESIPAGYTYLAQFITHDISFDEHSDRHIREDLPFGKIATPEFIRNMKNLRKPNFDLENVYGYENPTNRGELPRRKLMQQNSSLPFLSLGDTEGNSVDGGTAALAFPSDLPRGNACVEAMIVDTRNDENLILAQTLVAFIKFHNAMVIKLNESENYEREVLFEKARKLTIRYYQTIVLTDFLPRIVQAAVIEDIMPKGIFQKAFYQPDSFIPLEFSVAAFRFGHSMIRQQYNLNVRHNDNSPSPLNAGSAKLDELMMFTGRGEMNSIPPDLIRLKLPSIWIINWNLFFKTDDSPVNLAEPIDTNISLDLLALRPKVDEKANNDGRASSLAALDLYRGRMFGLPTGQDVAVRIGVKPLESEQIAELITSKKIKEKGLSLEKEQEIKERLCKVFAEKTPLWFYILAEAEIQNDGKLGDVGSRIVAETIIQLIYHSEYSILQQDWKTDEDFLLNSKEFFANPQIKTFGMPEMLQFIQEMNEKYSEILYPDISTKFNELNPLGNG